MNRLMDLRLRKAFRRCWFGLIVFKRLRHRRCLQTGRCAGQNSENAQALAAVCARRCPDLDAIEKMLTLGLQGLTWLERNGEGLRLQWARHAVLPIDTVGKH